MAARKNRGTKDLPWADVVRDRIRSAKLESRMLDAFNGKIKLTPTQLKAGEILMRKIMPDLSATELSGEIDNKHRVVSGTPLSDVDWEKQYGEAVEQPMSLPAKVNGNGAGH